MQLIRGRKKRPRKIVLYAPHGVGKSSWAAKAPDPIFFDIEGGLEDIDCVRTPRFYTWDSFFPVCGQYCQTKGDFRTIVVDTLDWVEALVHKKIVDETSNADSITDGKLAYGHGYNYAAKMFHGLLTVFDSAVLNGMAVILLAHAKTEKIDPPGNASYTRYSLDLHKSVASMICEWADDVLFANTRTYVVAQDAGFNKTRGVASGGTERYIQTCGSAVAEAKNRCNLPPEIPMDWDTYMHYVGLSYQGIGGAPNQEPAAPVAAPLETQPAPLGDGANIGGLVVNGSSKVEVN